MHKLISATHSQMGSKHIQNDDSCYAAQEEGIFIICDGVSEGGQGKAASNFIVQFISDRLRLANSEMKKKDSRERESDRLMLMHEYLQDAFTEAQLHLKNLAENNPLYRLAATTCIALWFNDRFAVLGHIGDSRAYLFRSGTLYQLTRDHSGLDEMLKMGMPYEKAVQSPMARALTRAFGRAQFNHPDILKIEFESRDVLFLCTDGVYTALNSTDKMTDFVHDLLNEGPLDRWIEKCSRVSGDDSTLVKISFSEDEGRTSPSSINASDRIQLVEKAPLSRHLDFTQKSHVAAICNIERFTSGTTVIREGDDGDSMYLVASGSLDVVMNQKVLKQIRNGDFFGEIALVQNSKRTASVVAREDTFLLSLKRADLEALFKKDPLIETRFYRAMLESVLDRVVDLSSKITSSHHA